MTSQAASFAKTAATDESTPPDMATITLLFLRISIKSIFNQLMLGYDQKEIGKALGCSHQAISQRVAKIKKILSEKGLLNQN